MTDHYMIKKMKMFCRAVREEAVKCISKPIKEDLLDDFITLAQCASIIKKKCYKDDESGKYFLDEDIYLDIVTEIAKQIYQSALSKLAADNIVQCAWDDDHNEMVFWLDDEDQNKKIYNNPK